MKRLALAVCLGLTLGTARAEGVSIPLIIDGVQRTVVIDAAQVWRTLRAPDAIYIPAIPGDANSASYTISARDGAGAVWSVSSDGHVWKDGMPFTTATVSMLTLVGNGIFVKSKASGQWSRWNAAYNNGAGRWELAPTANMFLLEPPPAPAASTAMRKGPLLAHR